jgi:hypothetical protein
MLGNNDANSGRIFVSYTAGTTPTLVTDNNAGGR